VIGAFAAVRGGTVLLAVQPGADPLRVPLTAIRGVYVSRGRPPRWHAALRSAVMPALAGAAVRGLVASVRRRDGDPTPAQAALTGAAMSAVFGAAKGALFPKERWHRVSLLAAPRADSLVSDPRGVGVRAGDSPR
jgi:hypothetical protein